MDLAVSLELRKLWWAITAAQHNSLRRAAEALNMRQSTLSRGICDLEHELGVVLFERTNGGTRSTIEGQEFLEAAKKIIEETETIAARLKTRSYGKSGQLTIGVHAALSVGNLRAMLIEHRRRFPNVEMHLVDGSSNHLISDLASTIDLAFVVDGKQQWGGRSLSVWNERVVVALPEDHPLSSSNVVYWNDLKQDLLLFPQQGLGPEFLQLLVTKLGYPEACRLIHHNVSLDVLLSLVGAGWGILLVLEGATGLRYQGVEFREVHDSDGATRFNFRAYWRQTNRNPCLRTFLDMLRERYPDLSTPQLSVEQ